jgi:type II secretory pathway component HofQ
MEARAMRRPPLRYAIAFVVASVIALVGLIWSLTIGKRSPIAVRQRAAQNLPLQADLNRQLREYRKRINELAREEFWALVEAENEAEALAKSRGQAEHVWRYGVPAHVEYYTQMIARSSKAAAASRERAASFGRKKRELEDAFYRLWETVPPDLWNSLQLASSLP